MKRGQAYHIEFGFTTPVDLDDRLWFELSTRDRVLAHGIGFYKISVYQTPGNIAAEVPSALHFPEEEELFGQSFRGWAYAGYNGNRDKADMPIIESDLVLPPVDRNQFDRNARVTAPNELESENSPEEATGVLFYPEPALDRWRGYDEGSWITAGVQSSSRLNLDYISVPRPGTYAGASAVNRLSESKQTGVFAGFAYGSGSYTTGDSKTLLDFMDMNGDRFPDVVSQNGIQ